MRTIAQLFLALALLALLAAPAVAEDDRSVVADIDAAIVRTEAELSGLGARAADEDILAFESSSRGLVEVEVAEVARLAPLVRALRARGLTPADIETVESRVPGLWPAMVLLDGAPTDGQTETWLRERFAHLQDDERDAAYAARRDELLDDLDVLRQTRERFSGEHALTESATREDATTETATGEAWCREHGLGETLHAEGGRRLELGTPIPPLETLPAWCREPLLTWLIELQGGAG